MCMRINEPGQHRLATQVKILSAFWGREANTDGGDAIAVDANIDTFTRGLAGPINQANIAKYEYRGSLRCWQGGSFGPGSCRLGR